MRPYVICHMMSSVDGKTDPQAIQPLAGPDEYEVTGDQLGGDAWICGRATLQKDFAQYAAAQPVAANTGPPAGPQPPHIARTSESYAIAADTNGQIDWNTDEIDGDHIITLLTEAVAPDYLTTLRSRGVSYIVSGAQHLDLAAALEALHASFGIKTLLAEGGGHFNGGMLAAGLVDELSLVLVPGIDGRHTISASFDGLDTASHAAVPLRLLSITTRPKDALWLRYQVDEGSRRGTTPSSA